MKKLLTVLSLVLGLGLATAQQVTPQQTTPPPPPKAEQMQTARPAVATKTTNKNSAIKMKKDGTPDKRYKANEHLKKDGTPDKRFKKK